MSPEAPPLSPKEVASAFLGRSPRVQQQVALLHHPGLALSPRALLGRPPQARIWVRTRKRSSRMQGRGQTTRGKGREHGTGTKHPLLLGGNILAPRMAVDLPRLRGDPAGLCVPAGEKLPRGWRLPSNNGAAHECPLCPRPCAGAKGDPSVRPCERHQGPPRASLGDKVVPRLHTRNYIFQARMWCTWPIPDANCLGGRGAWNHHGGVPALTAWGPTRRWPRAERGGAGPQTRAV